MAGNDQNSDDRKHRSAGSSKDAVEAKPFHKREPDIKKAERNENHRYRNSERIER